MAQIPISQGVPITPKQVIAQWRNLPHKFQVNVWNFEVKAGKAAQAIFQESFDLKRFNSAGSSHWPSRSKFNKAVHPLMVETGSLKKSIKWKHAGTKDNPNVRNMPRRQFIGNSSVLEDELKKLSAIIFQGFPK